MPRRFFRRISADYRGKQGPPPWHARLLAGRHGHPGLLAVSRRNIAVAMGAGLAISLLPVPGHIVLAVLAAAVLRVNVAVTLLAIWLSNPLTYGPILYGEYRLGALLLGRSPASWPADLDWETLVAGLGGIWQPLLAGGLVAATVAGILGYLVTDRLWRWSVGLRYRRRRNSRQA